MHDALGEIPLTSPECLKLAVCKLQDNIGTFPQDKLRVFRALSRMGRRLNALAEEVRARLRDRLPPKIHFEKCILRNTF